MMIRNVGPSMAASCGRSSGRPSFNSSTRRNTNDTTALNDPHDSSINFLDTITFARSGIASGSSGSASLAALAVKLKTKHKKSRAEHNEKLTWAYISYCLSDVQITWEIFQKLRDKYKKHDLAKPMNRLISTASLGKAYLDKFGVPKFLATRPEFDHRVTALMMAGYLGGRSEVNVRLEICQVAYLDFKIMVRATTF
jgi:hypothetical protein